MTINWASPWTLGAIIATAVIIIAIIISAELGISTRKSKQRDTAVQRVSDSVTYAFIINPSKPEAQQTREYIEQYCAVHGIVNPLFIETQVHKDGGQCAQEALAQGANVVIAVGGDGTVRTAAQALARTPHAFGVIPIGTGNLFARNMGIPVGNIEAAMAIATSHGSRRVDIGRLRLLDSRNPRQEHGFLVIAGAGFDAYMIDETNDNLKSHISWLAYFTGAFKHLFSKRSRGTLTMTTAAGLTRTIENAEFRTIMAGNCGSIPGFTLMPDAEFDDGLLDLETIDVRSGLIGWSSLFLDVVYKTIYQRSQESPLAVQSTVRQYQVRSAEVLLDKPVLTQVDGDILLESNHFIFSVDHKALLVRAPEVSDTSATGTLTPISAPLAEDHLENTEEALQALRNGTEVA